MRRPLIAGNWKMNKTPREARALIAELLPLVRDAAAEVAICPPLPCLAAAGDALMGSCVALGAQNVYFENSGAYTGEASADMLAELGVSYVIIGHSERRRLFGETDETVNKKVIKALEKGLKPIICVGENLDEKEKDVTEEVVRRQTKIALHGLYAADIERCVIAYEPIWAIGTGVANSPEEANATIKAIRRAVRELCADAEIRILYGGSMNDKNATSFMAQSDIDGGLIGGASLKAESFAKIVHF